MQDEINRLMTEIQRSRYTERRTEPRLPFTRAVDIVVTGAAPVSAFSKDMSAHGIGIVSQQEFQAGTVATLVIHSTKGDPVRLRAEARWCDAFGRGWFLTGWKFVGSASAG